MSKASGTIYRSGGKERVSYATIKAYKTGKPTKYETTDESGEFTLDLQDKGTWTFVAFEKGSFASEPQQVDMDNDQKDIKINLDRIAETPDDKAGRLFFWIMLGVFGLWIALYLLAHLVFVDGGRGFRIWTDDPLRYLEILLWGLAGILVSKIFTIGWYLRNHRFYREGVLMHIAHLVATPVLVLITVLLLSQVSMTFTLANSNQVTIDLSVPTIMIAFAFIIGTSPWPLWNFILNTAKRFTSQLG
jgi:hypothetical protein